MATLLQNPKISHDFSYIPKKDGTEPCGTANKFLSREYKTLRNFIKFRLGNDPKFRIYSFTNFYDESTFILLKKEN